MHKIKYVYRPTDKSQTLQMKMLYTGRTIKHIFGSPERLLIDSLFVGLDHLPIAFIK